jgi:hypothetical protein
MMEYLKSVSPNFELRGLADVLHEGDISLDIHIGPVLVLPASLWPFRSRHPLPIALTKYCSIVTERYSTLFPGRLISFPIEDWVVHVRDTATAAVLVGNGVQAEVLLFLNDHAGVAADSLEPRIASAVAAAALASLATARCPVLKEDRGRYSVNRAFRRPAAQVSLPRPAEVADGARAVALMRDEATDAHIVRIMKGRRMMPAGELAAEIRSAVADLFPIDIHEIRQRIHSLATRDFIQIREDGNVVYVP